MTVAANANIKSSWGYKVLSGLEKVQKVIEKPFPVTPEHREKMADVLKTGRDVARQGAAAVGEIAGPEVVKSLFPFARPVMDQIVKTPDPVKVFKERAAFVGENIERRIDEKKIRADIEKKNAPIRNMIGNDTWKKSVEYQTAEGLSKDPFFTKRTSSAGGMLAQGILGGSTYGVFSEFRQDMVGLARQMQNPYTAKEIGLYAGGELAGGLASYGAVAGKLGSAMKSVKALRAMSVSHPFLFEAGLQNLAEEAVDMTIRKASGQEYGMSDFILGMGFGASATALFGKVERLRRIKLPEAQKQVNEEIEKFYVETGRYPNFETELRPIIESQPVRGGDGITWAEALQAQKDFRAGQGMGENRMIGMKGGKDGRPGIDQPSPPPQPMSMLPDGQPVRITEITPKAKKPTRKQILGESDPKMLNIKESTGLAKRLESEARGARRAFFTTKRSIKEVQKEFIEYVKEVLPKAERGRLLNAAMKAQDGRSLQRSIDTANRVVEQVNRKGWTDTIKEISREKLEDVPLDVRKKIESELELYNLSTPTQKTLEKATFAKNELAKGTQELDTDLIAKSKILDRTDLSSLSSKEIEAVHDHIVAMYEDGLIAKQIRTEAAQDVGIQDARIVADALDTERLLRMGVKDAENLSPREREKLLSEMKDIPQWQITRAFGLVDREYMTPDRFFDMLDGYRGYHGPIYTTFKRKIDVATNMYRAEFENDIKGIDGFMKKVGKVSKDSLRRISVHGLFERVEENGRYLGREKLRDMGITAPEKLTDQEMQIYNYMRGVFDSKYDRLMKVLAETEGRDAPKATNYWPLLTDYNSDDVHLQQVMRENAYGLSRDIRAGSTIEARGGKQSLELNAAAVFNRHLEEVVYYSNVQPAINQLKAVMDAKVPEGLADAGRSIIGDKVSRVDRELIGRWLGTVATNGAIPGGGSWMTRWSKAFRHNTAIATFAFNLGTMAKQPLAIANGAFMNGLSRTMWSAMKVGSHPFANSNQTIQFAMKNSVELRNRFAGEYGLMDLSRDGIWIENVPYIGSSAKWTRKAGMYMMQKLDLLTATATWDAAFTAAKKTKGMDDEAAKLEADLIVRLTQSSGLSKDMPFITQRGEFARAAHQFQSFVINDWNLIKHDIIRSGLMKGGEDRSIKKRMQALTGIFYMMAAASLEDLISAKGDQEKAQKMGLWSFVAEKTPVVNRIIQYGKYGSSGIPVIDISLRGGSAAIDLATGKAKTPRARGRAKVELMGALGAAYGIPITGMVKRNAIENLPESQAGRPANKELNIEDLFE